MTPQHAQSSGGGSAGRAIVLVVVAVALGAFLLARGFDDSDDSTEVISSAATEEPTTDDPEETDTNDTAPTTTTTPPTTTEPPVVTKPPGQVKVAVMNGTGVRGRAGRTADTLNATGFVTAAKNTAQDRVAVSVIYYRPGYGDDAKSVASVLGAPPDIIESAPGQIMTLIRSPESPADLKEFNIFAVVGTDNVILDPDPPAASG